MEDISKLRDEINAIDDEICRLFCQRMLLSSKIADYKKEKNLPVLDSSREQAILDRISAQCESELSGYSERLFKTLFSISRDYQTKRLDTDKKKF